MWDDITDLKIPCNRPKHWGYQHVIGYLRRIFVGQKLPLDATPHDILFWAAEFLNSKDGKNVWYRPTDVQYVGPGAKQDKNYKIDRITVVFNRDRYITDVSVG